MVQKDKEVTVLLISACGLPIPAVYGGAVPALIQTLMDENKNDTNSLKLQVITSYDAAAIKAETEYPDVDFVHFKETSLIRLTDKMIDRVFRKRHRYLWKIQVLNKLRKYLLENNPDRVVFENQGFLLNVLKDKRIIQKYKGRLYYHVHNDVPENIYKDGLRACHLVLISSYLIKKINRICGEQKYSVLKNGFDTEPYSGSLPEDERLEIRRKCGVSETDEMLLFVGRTVPEKGIIELLDAVEGLPEKYHLVIVGSLNFGTSETSEFTNRMHQRIEALGSRVVATGYIAHKNVWKYYKAADMAVLPSTWNEPAGLAMCEAAAAGCPLITTNGGGIPEYIDSRYALLLEINEDLPESIRQAVLGISNDRLLAKEKAEACRKKVLQIVNVKSYYNEFKKLIVE